MCKSGKKRYVILGIWLAGANAATNSSRTCTSLNPDVIKGCFPFVHAILIPGADDLGD